MARGATVVVRRGDEVLVLRRTEFHANGDWEWAPPSGAAEPGESVRDDECAPPSRACLKAGAIRYTLGLVATGLRGALA